MSTQMQTCARCGGVRFFGTGSVGWGGPLCNCQYPQIPNPDQPIQQFGTATQLVKLKQERDEAREIVLGVFTQSCQRSFDQKTGRARYDHCCLSAYETAQYELIKWGLISKDDCERS